MTSQLEFQKTDGFIRNDHESILSFYKDLFNYRSIYIFPAINQSKLKPLLSLGAKNNDVFDNALEINWLNFYHPVIFREKLKNTERSRINDFLGLYELDILYPIRFQDKCYGFLGISNNGKQANDQEVKIGQVIIRYLSYAWHNRDLLYDIEQSANQTNQLTEEIATLLEVSQAIESGGNIQNLLELIISKCMNVMKVEAASLMLMTDNNKKLEFRIALGPKGKEVKRFYINLGQGIAGTVAQTEKSLIIEDAYNDSRFDPRFDKQSGFKTRSIMCVPLTYRKKIIGVVEALNRFDGRPFTEHDLRTFNSFATQAAIAIQNSRLAFKTIEKKRLDAEINIASEIQRLIVPAKLPSVPGFDVSGYYMPFYGIGGDFYGVFPVKDDKIIFCIADVSGKSVPGALLVSTLHATLKAYLEFTTDIKWIADQLNRLIMELSTANHFITLFLSSYNSETSELSYISAGHNTQYIVRDADIITLKSSGICIGLIDFNYEIQKVKLQIGDILVLYTDGIIEAKNKDKEPFGEKRLKDILLKNRHKEDSADEIAAKVQHSIKEFIGAAKAFDDSTLLIAKKVAT